MSNHSHYEIAIRPKTGKRAERYIAKMTVTTDELEELHTAANDELSFCNLRDRVVELIESTGAVQKEYEVQVRLYIKAVNAEAAEEGAVDAIKAGIAEVGNQVLADFNIEDVIGG